MSLESAQVEEEYENVVRTIVYNHGYRGLQGSASVTVGLGPFVSILNASPYQLGCVAADLHIPCRRDQAAVDSAHLCLSRQLLAPVLQPWRQIFRTTAHINP